MLSAPRFFFDADIILSCENVNNHVNFCLLILA